LLAELSLQSPTIKKRAEPGTGKILSTWSRTAVASPSLRNAEFLKNEADAMDVSMKKEEAQLRSMTMGLQKLNPGSAEYKQMEEKIAREKTDWTIKVQQQGREYLMREAKMYNDTYKEIEDEVNYFCQANGILLVLRFIGDPVEEFLGRLLYCRWQSRKVVLTGDVWVLKRASGTEDVIKDYREERGDSLDVARVGVHHGEHQPADIGLQHGGQDGRRRPDRRQAINLERPLVFVDRSLGQIMIEIHARVIDE